MIEIVIGFAITKSICDSDLTSITILQINFIDDQYVNCRKPQY